jgi:hypothetical protein
MLKLKKTISLIWGLVIIGSFILNGYMFYHLYQEESIRDFFTRNAESKNMHQLRNTLNKLIDDIEAMDNIELPPVTSVNILLSPESQSGIFYNGMGLELRIPIWALSMEEIYIRAYLAHEIMHYSLGHLRATNIRGLDRLTFIRELPLEIEADRAAIRFVHPEVMTELIQESSWDENEKTARIKAIEIYAN